MENTPITGHDATKWQEHMKEKHLWFRKMRGDISNEEFAEKLRLAIGHAKGLAAAHLRRKDPGGSALGKSAALVSKLKGLLCTEVTLPQASDSDNFVTSAFHVHLGPTANKSTEGNVGFAENDGLETYFDAAIKLRPKRGASRRWKLETARVFLFNAKFGTWNLVENSGFNEEKGYIYAEAYRDGIYAAIGFSNWQRYWLRSAYLPRIAPISSGLPRHYRRRRPHSANVCRCSSWGVVPRNGKSCPIFKQLNLTG
jgi:hypothetical protein